MDQSKILLDTINAMVSNSHESILKQMFNAVLQALPVLVALGGLLLWKTQLTYKHNLDVKLLEEKVRVDKEAKKNEIEMGNRQKAFEEKRTLAKEALLLTYQMRDAMLMVRAPFVSSGEQNEALKQINDAATEENKETSGVIAAYRLRWKNVAESGSKINLLALQLEAYFGRQGKSIFDAILNGGRELYSQIFLWVIGTLNDTHNR